MNKFVHQAPQELMSSRLLFKNVKHKHSQHYNFTSFRVLYGCETWSLTLREEHRLRVCQNRVLRGTLGPKGCKPIGGSRKQRN
jgi:hypothetical protein